MRRRLIAVAAASLAVLGGVAVASPAFAAGPTGTANVTANATVNETLTFSITSTGDGNGTSFTLPAGNPGDTKTLDDAVAWQILTNDPGGWSVTIAGAGDLGPIPLSDLQEKVEAGTLCGADPIMQPVTTTGTTDCHVTGSSLNPQTAKDDYQITYPNVAAGNYSTTLTYTAIGA